MKLEDHEKRSVELFGTPWTEVHVFLDRYAPMFRGADHRRILHTQEGVVEVVKRFGEESRQPAEVHIKDDWRGYCGLYVVPELKEIDLDDWLFINEFTIKVQDELIKELRMEDIR